MQSIITRCYVLLLYYIRAVFVPSTVCTFSQCLGIAFASLNVCHSNVDSTDRHEYIIRFLTPLLIFSAKCQGRHFHKVWDDHGQVMSRVRGAVVVRRPDLIRVPSMLVPARTKTLRKRCNRTSRSSRALYIPSGMTVDPATKLQKLIDSIIILVISTSADTFIYVAQV